MRATSQIASLVLLPGCLLSPVVAYAAEPTWLRRLLEESAVPGAESALSKWSLAKDPYALVEQMKSNPQFLKDNLSEIPDRTVRDQVTSAIPHLSSEALTPVAERELQVRASFLKTPDITLTATQLGTDTPAAIPAGDRDRIVEDVTRALLGRFQAELLAALYVVSPSSLSSREALQSAVMKEFLRRLADTKKDPTVTINPTKGTISKKFIFHNIEVTADVSLGDIIAAVSALSGAAAAAVAIYYGTSDNDHNTSDGEQHEQRVRAIMATLIPGKDPQFIFYSNKTYQKMVKYQKMVPIHPSSEPVIEGQPE